MPAVVIDQGRFTAQQTMLDAVAGVTHGTWQRAFRMHPFTITCSGAFVATVKVLVSNASTKPDDADDDHPQLGSDLTGPGSVVSDGPYEWVKVLVPAWTSGPVSAAWCAANNAPARG